jgi:restriction endonuclease S subunit
MKRTYSRAFIKKGDALADSKWEFWTNEKIVIAGMTKVIEAVYCTEPLGLGVGVYAIYDYGIFDPRFLLALLNSKYLSYYLNVKFQDKHLAGGYLAINKSTIEELPLVAATRAEQKPFVDCVGKIVAAISRGSITEVEKLEREMDERVYAIYGLTPDEIRAVEESVSN